MRYYKVLKNGKSFHGGYMAYPLPVGDQPGEWVKHDGDISPCRSGLHVTTEPARWMAVGADVFEAEIRGEILPCDAPDKFVCRELRLIKKLSESELIPLNVFSSGTHEIKNAYAFCYDSSTIHANDSSTVHSYGYSTVHAYGYSTVRAYESSTITAYGSSTIHAYGSSAITAYGSSTVRAYESSTITAYDSSTIHANDSSTVHSYGYSTVHAYESSAITAYGSSAVRSYESSTIRAYGSSRVHAYESSAITAYESSTITAYDSTTIHARGSSCVTIQSKSVTFFCNDYAVIIDRSNDGKPVVTIGDGPK